MRARKSQTFEISCSPVNLLRKEFIHPNSRQNIIGVKRDPWLAEIFSEVLPALGGYVFTMLIFFVLKSKNLDAYVIVFWHQSVFKFRDFDLGVSEVRDILVALLVISNYSSLKF